MVMCEKPLGRNSAKSSRMFATVEAAGAPNMVWYSYRRMPAVILAKHLVEEGVSAGSSTIAPSSCRTGRSRRKCRRAVRGSGGSTSTWQAAASPAISSPITATTETFVKEMHNLTGRSKGLASMTRAPSSRASRTARSRPSRQRAMRTGTRRPPRSRSTASILRFPGICTICIACSISTTSVKAACVAGVRYMSATVIILR